MSWLATSMHNIQRQQVGGIKSCLVAEISQLCWLMCMWLSSLAFGSRLQTNWTGYLHPQKTCSQDYSQLTAPLDELTLHKSTA